MATEWGRPSPLAFSTAAPKAMAADVGLDPVNVPADIRRGLRDSMNYITNRFLDDRHWSRISEALADRWDRFQAMTAAIKLLEQHGVVLAPHEEESLARLSDADMIDALIRKMPQQSEEQFQKFFLQLQLLVSTAGRVQEALEMGQAHMVEQALLDADETGITQYTLKMAIVQAGVETVQLRSQHESWVRDAEAKMFRLLQGQQEAVQAKGRLDKARAQLAAFHSSNNDHIKQALMSSIGRADFVLVHSAITVWYMHTKKMVQERAIYEEYRDRIEFAEERLTRAKLEQKKNAKTLIEKHFLDSVASLREEVLRCWSEVVKQEKHQKVAAAEVKHLQAQLQKVNIAQHENARKVLARIGADTGTGLLHSCFHEWVAYSSEYKRNQDLERRVRDAEHKMLKCMQDKKASARSILQKVAGTADSGLLHTVFTAWREYYIEDRRSHELADVIHGNQEKFKLFGLKSKHTSMCMMERAYENGVTMLYLRTFGAWRLFAAVEILLQEHGVKLDGKRHQLVGVQQMFRRFANDLETTCNTDRDDDRDLRLGVPHRSDARRHISRNGHHAGDGGLTKSTNTSSLPDIRSQDARNIAGARYMGQTPLPTFGRDSGWR